MMPSEQMATAQSLVRDIEVRCGGWDDPARPLVAPAAPRGAVIVSHGFAEHGGCYRRSAEVAGHAGSIST